MNKKDEPPPPEEEKKEEGIPDNFDEVLGSLCEYVESIRPMNFNQDTETYQSANLVHTSNVMTNNMF